MNLNCFLDDPTEIYDSLIPAWKSFAEKFHEHADHAMREVHQWKEAEDLILPIHPFSQVIDTTQFDGIWRDRRNLFVPRVKNVHRRVRHGFDKSGQIVIAERERSSVILIRGENFFDVGEVWRKSDGTLGEIPERPHYVRYVLDDQSRIKSTWNFSPAEEGHLRIEIFCWEKNRLSETYAQTFDAGTELPGWAKELSPERQAGLYRQASDLYHEFSPSRAICRLAYSEDGTLVSAERYRLHRPNDVTIVYTRSKGDLVEALFEELLPLLSEQIIETLKKAKRFHPLKAIALFYSAEHIHTGLPWGIGTVPKDVSIHDVADIETFSDQLDWPPVKPTLQRTVNRFMIAVESSPEYRDRDAPRIYRELLWQVSLRVAKEMQRTKMTDKDFTVLPIDDHGDIDTRTDFEDCIPIHEAIFFPLLKS